MGGGGRQSFLPLGVRYACIYDYNMCTRVSMFLLGRV